MQSLTSRYQNGLKLPFAGRHVSSITDRTWSQINRYMIQNHAAWVCVSRDLLGFDRAIFRCSVCCRVLHEGNSVGLKEVIASMDFHLGCYPYTCGCDEVWDEELCL